MGRISTVSEWVDGVAAPRAARARAALAAPSRSPRMAVVIGRLLGSAFLICFLTGLYSHFLQDPLPWMRFPTHPANLYQITQGIHVTVGIACIPLVLGKLWVVYANLFQWPAVSSILQGLERISIAVLVASALLEPLIGLVNTYQWYPWPFPFRGTHYGLAWVIVGSLAVHIAVKLPVITEHWRRDDGPEDPETPAESGAEDGEER